MYLLPLPTTFAPELRTSHLELRTSFPFGDLGSMDIFPFVTSFVIKMHVFRVKTAALLPLHLRHFEKVSKYRQGSNQYFYSTPGLLLLHYPTSHRLRPKAGQPVVSIGG